MSTDILLETLIQSDKELKNGIASLTSSVNALVTIQARSEEREKIQVTKNKKYDDFIDENSYPLKRLIKSQTRWDKIKDKVYAAAIFAILGLLGAIKFLS